MRRLAGLATAILLVVGLSAPAVAHHRPEHPVPPGHQTTTTSTVSSTTSTSLAPTTTTTQPTTSSSSSTTTTTSIPTTTTTVASTTTTAPGTDEINLSSDWVITEDLALSGFTVEANGHEILIDGADVTWSDFTIRNAARVMWHQSCGVASLTNGQVVDSGVHDLLGFYPLHWHLCGDQTRGTVVDNVTVVNGRNHAFVPHGSNGISLIDTTALDIRGDAYWWDPGQGENDPHDLFIDNATVVGVIPPPSGQGRHRLSAFNLRGGTGLTIINSSATGVDGGSDCSGFHWPESTGSPAVWTFENNTADNSATGCYGIFVWQNDDENHVIDGFVGNRIEHGAYRNAYQYRNITVDEVVIHAISRTDSPNQSWSGGSIGTVILEGHNRTGNPVIFENIAVGSVVNNSDDQPATIIFDNTGLTCADVSGSGVDTVIVDGQEC